MNDDRVTFREFAEGAASALLLGLICAGVFMAGAFEPELIQARDAIVAALGGG